jgi:protein SCO1/2
MMSRRIKITLLAAVALAAGLAANRYYALAHQPRVATVLPEPREISAFKLTQADGHHFTEQNLQGHWTLLFFGFTHCPSICPTAMAVLNQMFQKLTMQKQEPMPQVIFVSVDPERDTPKIAEQYANGFNPHFVGLTGTQSQLKQLTSALSVMYIKVKNTTDKTYTIDHSGTILLINPAGKLAAIFSMPHQADSLAHDFQVISAS